MALGPARVHAQQHARPVAAFRAAGAGMDFDEGVVGVGFARQQRLDLPALGLDLDRLELVDAFLLGGGIAFHLAEFDESDGVFEIALELASSEPSRSSSVGALAHQLLREFGIVPEIGVFGFGVQFREAARRILDVKDASSAVPRTA